MRRPYPFHEIEPRWQQHWAAHETFRVANPGEPGFDASRPKFYVLDMFPYPSGAGLHVGHPEGYTATDITTRYKRMNGFNVLHPMGWDAFGLPAEQHAIKTGEHPRFNTQRNVDNFRRQLQALGFAYDWSREVNTTAPDYVRWTQWIFLQLYHSYFDETTKTARPIRELEERGLSREEIDAQRLAFVAEAPVNWSPSLGTVLANEEVDEWREKGETVERRPLKQWMLRITKFAERLLADLEPLDWPESIKISQRNWIGRSEGAQVRFALAEGEGSIEVFTTRPDTLFGATYMVLAPEHPLVERITTSAQREAVAAYRAACALKSDLDRTDLAKDKTGVATGAFAVNPVNGARIPVWIADYVLMGYGTGAIMAVPGHDERDLAFAEKFELPIVQVVQPAKEGVEWRGFVDDGTAIHSGFLDGLPTPEAKRRIIAWLEEKGVGQGRVTYKLRDWLFSRQRYWGEPFPIVWDQTTGRHEAIPESELPLLAPELDDYKPTGDPRGPLVKATDWIRYSETLQRETNTMPQWAGSCWYYLRYCDPRNEQRFVSAEAEKYWMGGRSEAPVRGGVDLYVGGTEHAVLHLLYARFWHKVLFDLGHVSTAEPFQRLVNQGLILGENGQKMSKSLGNVVNPDDVVRDYGADSLRLFEMFMGPLTDSKPWSTAGVQGVHRFLARVWRLVMDEQATEGTWEISPALQDVAPSPAVLKALHAAIKKVTADIEAMAFNTAISALMVASNELGRAEVRPLSAVRTLLVLLSPFAPHLTDELWDALARKFGGPTGLCCEQPWPKHDESLLVEDEVEIVVQIAGKMRDKLTVKKDLPAAEIEALVLALPKIAEALAGKAPKKVIVVPGRLVNVVP
ncbi:MAG: leucine--tRNA ligase [Verrucomicrobia bacterium]|nr:leucine--tRNA ligase [Verrucomicrobiota bacterium]